MIVLAVDDRSSALSHHRSVLRGRGEITVITASTLEEAEWLYWQHRDELSAIILDGCVPGDYVNTIPFILTLTQDNFAGILMAASGDPDYRDEMVRAGCTHQADKWEAAKEILTLLGVT